ncbi:right-handed parallel beta-helix repeat-containing protein [Marinicella sediminis]|uniref:Right-handed parallel beta-helix repeat-containing protein n=1 Tax=Marinicella sediminis TaxID=1792834 RepID=A0ABV7J6G7_9GAMM|nr:right-handed parallel beta-helix repeat-containing protein [Marinicella sediminis]
MKPSGINQLITATFLWLLSFQAFAVSCGDVLTSNTTLTADLHCTTGWYALEIGADGVTLDLNGHSLSGTTDLAGVVVYGRSGVQIKGNGGVIKGFWAGVNTADTSALNVSNVVFYDLGVGVVVSSGSDALIADNQFIYINAQGVFVANFVAGKEANNNVIDNNEFYESALGVELCGDDSDRNVISNNLIWKSWYYGIKVSRSDENTIHNNKVQDSYQTAIRLDNASYNQLQSNSLRVGDRGLEIYADGGSGCLHTGANRSFKNAFQGNHTIDFNSGIILGLGILSSSEVFKNQINNNKIYNNATGIFFNNDAHHNNAVGNAYTGTATPIVDVGVGNSY